MKKSVWILTFLAAALWGGEADCRGCAAGKSMLKCDFYVAKLGDTSHRGDCAEYAKIVDLDGASAKAAWYWLLADRPKKALDAAFRAVEVGQGYAAGYAAMALALLGNEKEARSQMVKAVAKVGDGGYFDKELAILARLYPAVDWGALKVIDMR